MQELIEAIESATNVSSITYDKEHRMWTIEFYSGSKDKVHSENLIDFLTNA